MFENSQAKRIAPCNGNPSILSYLQSAGVGRKSQLVLLRSLFYNPKLNRRNWGDDRLNSPSGTGQHGNIIIRQELRWQHQQQRRVGKKYGSRSNDTGCSVLLQSAPAYASIFPFSGNSLIHKSLALLVREKCGIRCGLLPIAI